MSKDREKLLDTVAQNMTEKYGVSYTVQFEYDDSLEYTDTDWDDEELLN